MSKVYQDSHLKCSFCNIVFPFLMIRDGHGNLYCSDKCLQMDDMVARADSDGHKDV